jgi:hypothetical protein
MTRRLVRSVLLVLFTACAMRPLPAQTTIGTSYLWMCAGVARPADTLQTYRPARTSTGGLCFRRDTLTPAPPASDPTPTVPSGWTLFAELRPVVPIALPFRIVYDVSSVTATVDPTGAPALAMRFPAGYPGGASPATVYYESFAVPRIRWEQVIAYPADYVKHQSSVDKSVFVTVADSSGANAYNAIYTMMYDPTRLIPAIGLQGIMNLGVSINLSPNLAAVELARGKRYTLACEATGNSANTANGTIACWLDGTKFLSRSGIQFTRGTTRFVAIAWVPTWGGAGGQLAQPQSVYLGALRVYR